MIDVPLVSIAGARVLENEFCPTSNERLRILYTLLQVRRALNILSPIRVRGDKSELGQQQTWQVVYVPSSNIESAHERLWNVGISHECERSEMAFRRILESASTE
jgi:hypothetical protein